MNVEERNRLISREIADPAAVFPRLRLLERARFRFEVDFGLPDLPKEPGLISIRGPRQYGKSTWLEQQVVRSLREFGPGSTFYLNGDEVGSEQDLIRHIRRLVPAYSARARARRLFIDEITAIGHWERALKILIDGGELADTLVVTTGSKAADLRRGTERLPGRKGKLARSSFLFLPITYAEFRRQCEAALGARTLAAYMLAGGSPVALNEIAAGEDIPEYVVAMTRDWVLGEVAQAGRERGSMLAVLEQVYRHAGTPLGYTQLARDAGLANNTVAAGYIDLLGDLMALAPTFSWDASRRVAIRRRPCKFSFINLLAALSFDAAGMRSIEDLERADPQRQGQWLEWLVAQELWRRNARAGVEVPEQLLFWSSGKHEIDFVTGEDSFIEVKRGQASAPDFAWFARSFPRGRLTVVCGTPFETSQIRGVRVEEFLLEE
ncbi:MAG TPA: ATPase [Planctomycetes bacterium]|nr:ATPase [Planctomycetota bacterium]